MRFWNWKRNDRKNDDMNRKNVKRIGLSLMLLVVIAATSGAMPIVVAAEQPQTQTPPSQQNEFVPIKDLPGQQEQIPAAPLVMAAYAFVWVALLVYVWSVWRRVGAVQRELADLRRRTERRA